MGQPAAPGHHSHRLKVNRHTLWKSTRRFWIRSWPLALVIYFIEIFRSTRGPQEFEGPVDLALALWAPISFGLLFGPLLFGTLFLGTKLKMMRALKNPGPGKPPREARRKL